MNSIRIWPIVIVAALTLLGVSPRAHAGVDVLVLIDASGSMATPRVDDPNNQTRFEAAKDMARSHIKDMADVFGPEIEVAVYTFSGSTATARTEGFIGQVEARQLISSFNLNAVGGGVTPLAGSLCDAVDALVARGENNIRILRLASDGEENATPMAHKCWGPTSMDDVDYTEGSWQRNVSEYVKLREVITFVDLFQPGSVVNPLARLRNLSDPDAVATERTRATTAGLTAAGPPTLVQFFTRLARETGGRLTIVGDQEASVPVFADFNGNSCVDRSDALLVARKFGVTGAPQDNPFDLDGDGVVGFGDYAISLAGFTDGGCGTADPYVSRAPLVCSSSTPITIDGQALEGDGITIETRGTCRINIRNSLIVSGQNAIKVQGTAIITVDNSILVGEGAVLTAQGSTVLSTANSVFHGTRTTQGAFVLVDRGGNTFE